MDLACGVLSPRRRLCCAGRRIRNRRRRQESRILAFVLLMTCCYLFACMQRGGKGKELEKNGVSMGYSDVARAQSSSGGIIPVTSFLIRILCTNSTNTRPL